MTRPQPKLVTMQNPNQPCFRRPSRAGFSLMEMILVLGIIALLAGTGGRRPMKRTITPRERTLLFVFCGLLALFVTSVLLHVGQRRWAALREETAVLRHRIRTLEPVASALPQWDQRDAWLDGAVPEFPSREAASAHLLESVLHSARRRGLDPGGVELLEPAREEEGEASFFEAASVRLNVAGVPEEVLPWVHLLQQPTELVGVTALEVTAGERFEATLEVTLWFRGTGVGRGQST